MLDYYTTNQIGITQSLTPEGFLLCRDVPISRTGTLMYGEHELVGLQGIGGIIHVERLPEDVFAPHSIASYAGKPIIDTHAGGEITPGNWREHALGTVLNPRKGEGEESNVLLADLLICDPDTIAMLRTDEKTAVSKIAHQVSAGYNAEYEQLAPGRARQYDIIGNHVALVENGRCGPRCAVGDSEMPVVPRRRITAPGGRATMDAAFATRLRLILKTGDEAALEDAINSAGPDGLGDDAQPDGTAAPDANPTHNITVNINGSGVSPDPAAAAPAMPGTDGMPVPAPGMPAPGQPPAEQVPAWGQAIIQRLAAIETAMQPASSPPDPEQAPPPEADADKKPTADDMPEGMDPDEGKMMTTDSMPTKLLFQDTMSRAEMLSPGIRLITLDARQTVRQTHDSLCNFRRTVLARATADQAMHARIAALVEGKNFKTMTCDQVMNSFIAASELVGALNNSRISTGMMPRAIGLASKAASPADINTQSRKMYPV